MQRRILPLSPCAGEAPTGRRIGILGGSFNPAHGGHLHVTLTALKRLALDEVWWLVSPQNPLKPVAGMAPLAARMESARRVARGHPRIVVSDVENRLGCRYTADTVKTLRRRFPRLRFVWLMGGDNLVQIRYWQRWTEIFGTLPIAVFDRPSYSSRALASLAATRFAHQRVSPAAARRLAEMPPPAWVFFHTRLDRRSASAIRAGYGCEACETAKEPRTELTTLTAYSPNLRPLPSPAAMPHSDLLGLVLETLEEGKAEDIVTIELAGKTTIADQMVIASGRSTRQVQALTEHLEAALSRRARIHEGPRAHGWAIEGKMHGDWVLIDAGDVIVHLFRPETRAYYNLEKLWSGELPGEEAVGS
jgi:nicotinate (nicotinamide) nucleotide adenylyltransferase/ribosome silencing factor RsfS/YbeB/iojap